MESIITILEFVLVLSFLAFLHELGHYLSSRIFNFEVEEFGLGIPPRLLTLFTWKGTKFTLNLIPFGAFVRPKGEEDPEVPGGFSSAHPLKRLVVFLGGPFMNLVTAIILFSVLVSAVGMPDSSRVIVDSVIEGSPAQIMDLRSGDLVLEVAGQTISGTDQVRPIIDQHLGKEITIKVLRDGNSISLTGIPRQTYPEGQGPLGFSLTNPYVPIAPSQAIPQGFRLTAEISRQLFLMPGRLISGQLSAEESRIVGPVGMFSIYDQAKDRDKEMGLASPNAPAVNALYFVALISVALGITNLLPLPALDGGRIIFLLPEIFLRKRVPPKYENLVHAIGMFALLALMFLVTIQDIMNPAVLP